MYASPKNQIEYFYKALGIEFENSEQWFEIKATRDVIVHNLGIINEVYINKAGDKSRGKIGEKILITQNYFRETISYLKRSIIKMSTQLKSNFAEKNN